MTKPRTGWVESYRRTSGEPYFRGRIRLADGSLERIDVPDKHSTPAGSLTARERAEQWVHAAQEFEDLTHTRLKARQARAAARGSGTVDRFAEEVFARRESDGKSSVGRERRMWRARVSPALGARPVADVSKDEIESFREALDAEVRKRIAGAAGGAGRGDGISGKTALIIWTLVRTVFKEAAASRERSKRVREDDPTAGVLAPLKTRSRKKTFLYPSEFAALMTCEAVPLEWRETYAVAAYLYLRPGELRALTWAHVDLVARVVHVTCAYDEESETTKATKTERGQREVPIPAELIPLLERMRARGPRGSVVPLLADVSETGSGRRSLLIREHLRLAGCNRPRLLEDTATTMAVNFRSLRDSGITWEALAGTPVDRIQARAGHEHVATTIGYCKAVEDFRGAYGAPFGALDFGGAHGRDQAEADRAVDHVEPVRELLGVPDVRGGGGIPGAQRPVHGTRRSEGERLRGQTDVASLGGNVLDDRTHDVLGAERSPAPRTPVGASALTAPSNAPNRDDSPEKQAPTAGLESARNAEVKAIRDDSGQDPEVGDDLSARPVEPSTPPASSLDALKLAIKLAVDEGDYTRAGALLDLVKTITAAHSSTTSLALVSKRG